MSGRELQSQRSRAPLPKHRDRDPMTRALAHRGGVVLRGTRDKPWRNGKKDQSPGNAVRHLGVEVARVLICLRCPRCGLRLQVS